VRALASTPGIEIVPSHFSHVEPGARLALVGQTPGLVQHQAALRAYETAIRNGHAAPVALRLAKYAASFSGPMRQTLVAMLDHVGVATAFGLPSSHALFDPALQGYVHHTSALQNPMFVGGQNYNGNPDMIRTPALRAMIETLLAEEVRQLPDTLWLPLGLKPLQALNHLAARGVLDLTRILPALPHPSGANGERTSYFLGRKARADLSAKTLPEPIDRACELLGERIAGLSFRGGRA